MLGLTEVKTRFDRAAATALFTLALLLVAVLSSGCVGPAKNRSVYEAKAANSLENALSAVETTRFTIDLALANRAFGPYQSVTIEDAEEDVSTAQGHFDSIQPPDRTSDALRAEMGELLGRASDAVEDARIAMRRGDVGTLRQLQRELAHVSDDLERFIEELESP